MKILQISTIGTTLDAFLIPFAKAFKEEGWDVDAASSDVFNFDSVVSCHDNCFDIKFSRNPLDIIKFFKALKALRALLCRGRYDIVHVHTPIAAFITRFAAIGISKTKIFYTAHGFHYIDTNPKWKNILFYLAEKIAGYKTDHLFVINEDDLKFALEKKILSKNSISHINGIGVDMSRYTYNSSECNTIRSELNISSSTFILLHIAELNYNKNHQLILKSLFLLKYEKLDLKYIIVGKGPLYNKLLELVEFLELESQVLFLGHRTDVPALISAADTICLSSLREGLPRCILEAMCAKKPVIASSIRGCTDLLKSGAGILVDINDIRGWSEAISDLYNSVDKRYEMGEVGIELIEKYYQQDQVIDSVINVYKRELNS